MLIYSLGMWTARQVRRPWLLSLPEQRLLTTGVLVPSFIGGALTAKPSPSAFMAVSLILLIGAATAFAWAIAPRMRRHVPGIETGLDP